MELTISQYFLLFIIYSFLGWCMEVACKLKEYKRFINRGFLIGPYCPIYGLGAIAITILLYRYSYDPVVLFVMSVITCMILEYTTSYVMEKLFKARWWDYSRRKFNLNGRVCLGTAIPFGILGLFIFYVSNPFIIGIFNKLNTNALNIIAIILLLVFVIDIVISTVIIIGFRKTAVQVGKEGTQDNTEEITRKVREILVQKSWLHRRLVNAYPKLIAIKHKIKKIEKEIKESAKEKKEEITEKVEDVKKEVEEKTIEVKDNTTEKNK